MNGQCDGCEDINCKACLDRVSRSEHQLRVNRFMLLARQELPPAPTIPSRNVRHLRAKLILEEALETIRGLGFDLPRGELKETCEPDLIEIADGCADLSVVNVGTLSACGLCDESLMWLVDNNNLDKFGPGCKMREDGKLIKPPGHRPPNIRLELERMRKKAELIAG